ncbi:MAG TPA: hypothetical protein VM284_04395 [Candidatus Limnocylindria bacterium]|nr:hypothetical protein [Candidatus Limnocylindria bacterium]
MRGIFIVAIIAIIAIILGILAISGAFNPAKPDGLTKPTDLRVTPVTGMVGAFDATWRFPAYSVDAISPRFSVTVNQTAVAEVRGNDGSAGGDRTAYSARVIGQPCDTPLAVQVTAFSAGGDLGRVPSDIVQVQLPCSPAAASPTTAPVASAAPTPAPQASSTFFDDTRLAPPEDFTLVGTSGRMHTVSWNWPAGQSLDPTFFRVNVQGTDYDFEFTGPGEYEVEVGAECGSNPNFLTLDAFNTEVDPEANSQAEEIIEADPGC